MVKKSGERGDDVNRESPGILFHKHAAEEGIETEWDEEKKEWYKGNQRGRFNGKGKRSASKRAASRQGAARHIRDVTTIFCMHALITPKPAEPLPLAGVKKPFRNTKILFK